MFYLQVSSSVTAVITGVIFRFANTASAITLPIPDKKKYNVYLVSILFVVFIVICT